MGYWRGKRMLACAFALIGASLAARGVADAQTAQQAVPNAQQLNPAEQTKSATRRRNVDVFSGPAAEACSLPDDPRLKFKLNGVDIEGTNSLAPDRVRNAYVDLAGSEITPATICEIRDRISQMLFRRGILARVLIPEQKIEQGRVRLKVIEAQIVRVRYHGDIGPAQSRVEAYLNRLSGLAPFDLDTAQRYLLLANDIPGVRATAALSHSTAPGAPAGGIDLDVALTRVAFDEVGAVQNSSSKSLGPWSGIARVDMNSLTSLGERTTLIGYTTLGNNSQEVVQLIEQARVGDSGLYAQGAFAYGRSHPGDVLKPLNLKGDSYVATLELDDPVMRLTRRNLTLGGGLDWIDQTTDFPGGGLLTNDHLRVLWARAETSGAHPFAHALMGGPYVTIDHDLTVQVRKGLDAMGASRTGGLALSRPAGRADAWVVRAEGGTDIRFEPSAPGGTPLTLSARFEGQWADRPLLSYEEQAIGDLTIGRGYDPAAVSGDRVIAGEVKAVVGPIVIGWLKFAPYGFLDAARVTNLDPGSQDITVRSVGGGVEFRLPYGVRGDLTYAEPLDKTFPSAVSKPPARLLFQLVIAH